MTTLVIKLQGKGKGSRADFVSIHTFDTPAEAEDFIRTVRQLDTKHWVDAFIPEPGQEYEMCSDSNT